jgi:hypothetical protein
VSAHGGPAAQAGKITWTWAPWLKTVALFALAGPPIGVACVLSWLLFERVMRTSGGPPLGAADFDALPGVLFYGFVFGTILGFPFAAVTGLLYATGAARWRWIGLPHVLAAALLASAVCIAVWFVWVGAIPAKPADWNFRELWNNSLIFVLPSLASAVGCSALSRRWWRS